MNAQRDRDQTFREKPCLAVWTFPAAGFADFSAIVRRFCLLLGFFCLSRRRDGAQDIFQTSSLLLDVDLDLRFPERAVTGRKRHEAASALWGLHLRVSKSLSAWVSVSARIAA